MEKKATETVTDTKEAYNATLLDVLVGIFMDEQAEPKKDDEIVLNENVMIEPYLNGTFTKWNSNGGWQNPESESASVQAFCHWTYHESGEKLLFCDAQGINKFDKYILTDPCIVSNKDFARDKNGNIINENEEQTYGVTDTGREFLLNWFRNHKCNEYCDKNWAKPTELDIESIPKAVKSAAKVKSSVFNSLVKGAGSVTLGNGSVLVGKKSRNNFTIGGIDYANSTHIYSKGNERIIKIGKMQLIDKENSEENEDCVMILTTSNTIVVVWTNVDENDEDNAAEDLEFTQKKVKQIVLDENNKYQFHLVEIVQKRKKENSGTKTCI